MILDGNYSTLNQNTSYYSFEEGRESRILVGISAGNYSAGITAGDVIRWDTVSQQYEKSKANSSTNAEVFGIVESADGSGLNVVIMGSINLVNDKIINRSDDGVNDIYFLSANNLGFLENIGPTFAGHVIKPIYQVAPHGNFTGVVRNYLGYKTTTGFNTNTDVSAEIISFSDDMTKMISFNPTSKIMYVDTLLYSSDTFDRTNVKSFNLTDVSIAAQVAINYSLNTDDCKVSNDGKDILIFTKLENKIFYIHINDNDNAELKQTLNVDVVGNPEDKLWACDDELSCMTISTRSLERESNIYDSKVTSHDISSKIKYFKRNMNSSIPYKWKQTFEHHSFGFCDSIPREIVGGTPVDSLAVTSGIYRTNDIKCHKKHFSLSTICLINDQKNYNSKITGYFSPRYTNLNKGITAYSVTTVSSISGDLIVLNTPAFMNQIYIGTVFLQNLINNPDKDLSIHRSYKCGVGFKNYRILVKDNNYYYEDLSHKDNSGIEYFSPVENGASGLSEISYSRNNTNPYPGGSAYDILELPSENIEASISKTCSTEQNIFCCFRYGSTITIFKFPFLSSDGINVFRYFEQDNTGSTVPSTSGYGKIFENSTLNLNDFNFYATDSTYFICASDKVYINGSLTPIFIDNLNKALFYNTSNGAFFKTSDKIYRYNITTQNFDEQIII
jgi:hypothetical protein